jgi:hypothetical protein
LLGVQHQQPRGSQCCKNTGCSAPTHPWE